MLKILFFILPAVVNIVTSTFFFVFVDRMASARAIGENISSLDVSIPMIVWGAGYSIAAFFLGRFTTKHNAALLAVVGQVVMGIALAGLLIFDGLYMQSVWAFIIAAGSSMFYVPFQAVIKLFGKTEYGLVSVVRNVATYVLSYSTGLALGPFVTGAIWQLSGDPKDGWRLCYCAMIGVVVFVEISLLLMMRYVKRRLVELGESDADAVVEPDLPEEQRKLPNLIWAGWALEFFGFIVVIMMRTHLQDHCTNVLLMSTSQQSVLVGMVSLCQAVMGGLCIFARRWPYKPYVIGFVSLLMAGGFVLFAQTSNFGAYLFGVCLLGIFSGITCFVFAFHALINVKQSVFYCSVNEIIVGGTSVGAPFLAGLVSDALNSYAPFYIAAGLMVLVAVIYSALTWKYRKI